MLRLLHLPRADSDSVHVALVARMQDLPPELMRSNTWDQGTEMARHLATANKLGAPVYFYDSRSPWQRGSNENANGLLRDYFPKSVTLRDHSQEHLLAAEDALNNRPNGPRRPFSGGSIRRPDSLSESVGVATLTRPHPGTDTAVDEIATTTLRQSNRLSLDALRTHDA